MIQAPRLLQCPVVPGDAPAGLSAAPQAPQPRELGVYVRPPRRDGLSCALRPGYQQPLRHALRGLRLMPARSRLPWVQATPRAGRSPAARPPSHRRPRQRRQLVGHRVPALQSRQRRHRRLLSWAADLLGRRQRPVGILGPDAGAGFDVNGRRQLSPVLSEPPIVTGQGRRHHRQVRTLSGPHLGEQSQGHVGPLPVGRAGRPGDVGRPWPGRPPCLRHIQPPGEWPTAGRMPARHADGDVAVDHLALGAAGWPCHPHRWHACGGGGGCIAAPHVRFAAPVGHHQVPPPWHFVHGSGTLSDKRPPGLPLGSSAAAGDRAKRGTLAVPRPPGTYICAPRRRSRHPLGSVRSPKHRSRRGARACKVFDGMVPAHQTSYHPSAHTGPSIADRRLKNWFSRTQN